MDESGWLAERFEEQRPRLRGVAYRMLGSASEADDAVQEACLRLSRADAGSVENLPAWLTTVVARVCLNMLRSRKSRREEPLDMQAPTPLTPTPHRRRRHEQQQDPAEAAAVGLSAAEVLLLVHQIANSE
jgi:RNA polymerase sigma factor (sigma-70 family)